MPLGLNAGRRLEVHPEPGFLPLPLSLGLLLAEGVNNNQGYIKKKRED